MGKQVTIRHGLEDLVLPDGRAYDGGQQVVLSDAHYALLGGSTTRFFSAVADVGDPTGPAPAAGRRLVATSRPFTPAVTNDAVKTLVIIGMTPAGRLFARDASGGNLSQSDDWGATWKHGCGFPTNTSSAQFVKMIEFKGYFYLATLDTTTSRWGIYRTQAVAKGATYSWSAPVFVQDALDVTMQIRTVFNADDSYLYVGEYTANAATGTQVYRSADGVTWNAVLDVDAAFGAGTRHIHSVTPDPYRPGHVYVAIGDNLAPASIVRSTDYGNTWEIVIPGTGQNQWQSVQLSFSPDYVWCASDRIGFDAMIFDRTKKVPMNLGLGWHYNLPVVPPAALADRYYQIGYWGAVDPATGVFHFISADTSSAGNTKGYFRILYPGAPVELVETLPSSEPGGEVFIGNGFVWIGSRRWPLVETVTAS